MEAFSSQICAPVEIEPASGAITALIVDDDRHVRSYLRMILRMAGVKTAWQADDVTPSLALYARHRPTVVLLDVDLPGVSGEAAMRQLLAVDSRAAVIAVTSREDLRSVAPCNTLGAIGWVPIYLVREEIVQRLSAALDRVATHDTAWCRKVA
jgi:DNA-binding NarL/FixJ family response regulator